MEQKYVVVANTRENRSEFRDHQGVGRMLGGKGEANDSIKLLLENLTEVEYTRALKMYVTLKALPGFSIKFSDNVDLAGIKYTEPKLVVISTADVDQAMSDRVAFLRKQTNKAANDKRLEDAREIRLNAARTAANGALEQAEEQKTASRSPLFAADEGTVINEASLAGMDKPALYEMAAGLGLNVKKGTSIGGLRKAILLTVTKGN